MKWEEVRKIYPNQFVKLEILKSHIEENTEIVDDVAIIEPVSDSNATRELLKSRDNTLVYHTSRVDIVMKLRNRVGLRRVL